MNRLNILAGTWTNAVGKKLELIASTLQRSVTARSNFSGDLSFQDGDPSTPAEDYFDWVLLVTDPNDSDGDGIPDLSDLPAVQPVLLFFTRIQRDGPEVVFEWSGEGKLQAADQVTGPWQDIAGAISPRRVTPSGARKFYRLTK